MARKVIKKQTGSTNNLKEGKAIIKTLKPVIKESKQTTLFSGVSSGSSTMLSSNERAYNLCCKAIRDKLTKGKYTNLSVQDLSYFFSYQFNLTYGFACIDYNIFNARNTFTKLMATYKWTELDLAVSLAKWFTTYPGMYKTLNTENCLTLSVLKKLWVVDKLIEDKGTNNFDGFY